MEQSIHYHVSEQQTSAYSGSTSCYLRCWAILPGLPLHLHQSLPLDHSRKEEVPSRIILSNLDFGSRFKDFAWLRIGALCLYYLSRSLPCAASSTKTWVSPVFITGIAKGYHLYTLLDLESRGTFLCCICYGIAEQY